MNADDTDRRTEVRDQTSAIRGTERVEADLFRDRSWDLVDRLAVVPVSLSCHYVENYLH
jgi:hypothetical protein